MILLIDNYDSFTYNLYQQIEKLEEEVKVFEHDRITIEEIKEMNPEKIVISPGPGNPEESGISMNIVQEFYTDTPVLGVCLGLQCIAQIFSSGVVRANRVFHGKTSKIEHSGKGIFKGVKNPFTAARYHSLEVNRVPEEFDLSAWTKEDEIMGMSHKKYPLHGVQFHPESFLTEEGEKIMKNFLNEKRPNNRV